MNIFIVLIVFTALCYAYGKKSKYVCKLVRVGNHRRNRVKIPASRSL